jgi:signal transduction histidine kinase
MSERQRLECQLVHAQKMESIGQLAAGIAHEINTPIQYIGDNTTFVTDAVQSLFALIDKYDQLLDPGVTPASWSDRAAEARKLVEDLDLAFLRDEVPNAARQTLDGVARVADIVRAMKDFSHPGSEEQSLADLNKAIESTITVCRNRWKYVADVETEFAEDLPPVPCLLGEFNQVILNLIGNAADAIAEVVGDGGARKGRITVRTRCDGEWVEIQVSDTGGGMSAAIQRKVFDPFFTTKEVGKGTGQGLAISHDVIVNKHGGMIDLQSEEGVGTTFTVRLPFVGHSVSPKQEAA